MTTKMFLAAIGVVSLLAAPAMAQSTDKEQNGHHYNGGPKTEVPHHMGKKETTGRSESCVWRTSLHRRTQLVCAAPHG